MKKTIIIIATIALTALWGQKEIPVGGNDNEETSDLSFSFILNASAGSKTLFLVSPFMLKGAGRMLLANS